MDKITASMQVFDRGITKYRLQLTLKCSHFTIMNPKTHLPMCLPVRPECDLRGVLFTPLWLPIEGPRTLNFVADIIPVIKEKNRYE